MATRWYFDFISPFAYLQWPRIRDLAAREDIEFRPVLLAGLLDHHGQKGPAEIPAKRLFTYRHVTWKAVRMQRPLRFPPVHPFNPLPALRLCAHAGASVESIESIFEHVWARGNAADTPATLGPVAAMLGLSMDEAMQDAVAKGMLMRNYTDAVADGIFGVPTLVRDGHLFWGEDATAMFEDFLEGAAVFRSDAMQGLDRIPVGAARRS